MFEHVLDFVGKSARACENKLASFDKGWGKCGELVGTYWKTLGIVFGYVVQHFLLGQCWGNLELGMFGEGREPFGRAED